MPDLQQQANAQALYMQYLLEKAKEQVAAEKNPAFDPQGRVLTTVNLNDDDYALIVHKINQRLPQQDFVGDINGLTQALGKRPTAATTVSLDEIDQAQFDLVVKLALNSVGVTDARKQPDLIQRYHQLPKGSVIPLQQEFDFHLGLVSRVYQKKYPQGAKVISEAKEAAMLEVNKLVMQEFAKALEKAGKEEGPLNTIELNMALDKARKKITSQAHEILVRELAKRGINKEQLQSGDESLEHLAEKTTATPNDMLHVDKAVGLITLIEGTNNTAHHRVPGAEHLARRQIVTHHLYGSEVKPNPHPRIQIRTPSLDVKKIKKSFDVDHAVLDVALKLNSVRLDYDLDHTVTGDARKPHAFIYNLHTALNDTLDEMMGSNKQSQGAEIIILGAHQYNEFSVNKIPPVFCFVQNISVNGRGDTLSHDATDPLLKEASLMSDLAILHTLYNSADEAEKTKIYQVFDQYKKYLKEDPRPHFFSESQHVAAAYQRIQEIKNTWAQPLPSPQSMDMAGMAQRGLQRLFAANLHQSHEFAKLAQALSVYCEDASISGCKSGNERAQAINGRVAILDAVSQGILGPEGVELLKSLSALSSASNPVDIKIIASQLNNAMNVTYNEYGLQLGACMISLADQGAAAKVEASTGYQQKSVNNNNSPELCL